MTAQGGRAAALNSPESLELLKIEAVLVPVQEAVALCAEDVGYLYGGAALFFSGGGRTGWSPLRWRPTGVRVG